MKRIQMAICFLFLVFANSFADQKPKLVTYTVGDIEFKMVYVEGGTFTMGGTPEQGKFIKKSETPAHRVSLPSYYIGQTEVTQALWEIVMGSNPSNHQGKNLPVERISWDDCQVFITKLNEKTGKKFRLPIEAEWEFAARGGKLSKGYKFCGSDSVSEVAWCYFTSNEKTHPVGLKKANELGIFDMSGNVWEWCQEKFNRYTSDGSPGTEPVWDSKSRVIRGGGSNRGLLECRVSNRDGYEQDKSVNPSIGLRLALSE